MSTTVTLEDAWFNLAADSSQSVTMVLTGESGATARPTETRRYAGGRVRSITRTGSKRQTPVDFQLADRSDLNTLEDWVGKTVLYRDPRGLRMYCVFAEVGWSEIPGVADDVINVNLTLTEVTFDESA